MARHHLLQRGAADLVSVAVGLTLLAVVFAGTTASFLYGREALAREEHFKTVAYFLRGETEEVQAAMGLVDAAANPDNTQNLLSLEWKFCDSRTIEKNNGREEAIMVTISRKAKAENLPETGEGYDYFLLEMRAQWRERDFAEDRQSEPGKLEELKFMTAVVVRRGL